MDLEPSSSFDEPMGVWPDLTFTSEDAEFLQRLEESEYKRKGKNTIMSHLLFGPVPGLKYERLPYHEEVQIFWEVVFKHAAFKIEPNQSIAFVASPILLGLKTSIFDYQWTIACTQTKPTAQQSLQNPRVFQEFCGRTGRDPKDTFDKIALKKTIGKIKNDAKYKYHPDGSVNENIIDRSVNRHFIRVYVYFLKQKVDELRRQQPRVVTKNDELLYENNFLRAQLAEKEEIIRNLEEAKDVEIQRLKDELGERDQKIRSLKRTLPKRSTVQNDPGPSNSDEVQTLKQALREKEHENSRLKYDLEEKERENIELEQESIAYQQFLHHKKIAISEFKKFHRKSMEISKRVDASPEISSNGKEFLELNFAMKQE